MASEFIHRSLTAVSRQPRPQVIAAQRRVENVLSQRAPIAQDDRRIDARFAIRTRCTYELMDGQDQKSTASPGEAYSLNISTDGILLLLDRKPQDRQLVAMRNPALRQHATTLFEVRWVTHIPVGTTHKRYMAGCHLTFGRFPYFLVQRHHLDQHLSGLSL